MKRIFTLLIASFSFVSSWATTPANPAINLVASFVQGNAITFNWTVGSGTYRIANKVILEWSTAQEFNSAKFEIERSVDGNPFEKIGSVNAAGNSSIRKDYAFTDNTIFKRKYSHRLKQVDIDERYIYSKLVSITIKDYSTFRLLENPVHDQLRILVNNEVREKCTVRIFDMSGKKYWSKQ